MTPAVNAEPSASARARLVRVVATLALPVMPGTGDIKAAAELPASVQRVYDGSCPPSIWISGERDMAGSASQAQADGGTIFLLRCGDAASSTPFSVIVLKRSGEASEAAIGWTLRGKPVGEGGMGNARFGPEPGTVVSSAHFSASCEPRFTHRWDGRTFQLIRRDTKGCRPGEL